MVSYTRIHDQSKCSLMSTLSDLTTPGVLIHRPHNCESILAQLGWQYWILPLLCDIPKELSNSKSAIYAPRFTSM